jgi:hypothetical protein
LLLLRPCIDDTDATFSTCGSARDREDCPKETTMISLGTMAAACLAERVFGGS